MFIGFFGGRLNRIFQNLAWSVAKANIALGLRYAYLDVTQQRESGGCAKFLRGRAVRRIAELRLRAAGAASLASSGVPPAAWSERSAAGRSLRLVVRAAVWIGLAGLLGAVCVAQSHAQHVPEGAVEPGESGAERGQDENAADDSGLIGLDRLLQLPESMSFERERKAGATAEEWRARFRESLNDVASARGALESAQRELEDVAGGGAAGWQVAPPGSNQTEISPISFKLREDLRRARVDLDTAERKHRALVIQADLAEVSEDWRIAERK